MRPYRAGDTIEDRCRACKIDRLHTIIVTEGDRPLRVQCDYCGSQHNYRGGGHEPSPRAAAPSPISPSPTAASARFTGPSPAPVARHSGVVRQDPGAPFPIVSDRERIAPPIAMDTTRAPDLEHLIRRIVREEAGLTPVVPAEKWRGGQLVLRPANPSLQEKAWPIETFFHKVVMLRNRLRTLEQQVNASALPDDEKVRLQAYVSGCYGTLTSFNVLFAEEEDRFRGAGGE